MLNERLELRLSAKEKAKVQSVAKAAGMSSSEYVRFLIRANEPSALKGS
ncbi:plasmid mobilization protein [Nocardioides bizhenqiangii]